MKKFLLTVITFIYLAMSSGIAMNVHYCMGKLAGTDFYNTANNKCGKCGMTEKQGKGCCKDEQKLIKLSVSHTQAVSATLNFQNFSAPVILQEPSVYRKILFSSVTVYNYGTHPPPDIRLKRNILYSTFRI